MASHETQSQAAADAARLDAALSLVGLRIGLPNTPAVSHQGQVNEIVENIAAGAPSDRHPENQVHQTQTSVQHSRGRREYPKKHLAVQDSWNSTLPLVRLQQPPTRSAVRSILIGGHAIASASTSNTPPRELHATKEQPFNLWEALCTENDIMLSIVTQHLPPHTFLTLFTISKSFNRLVSRNMTSYILCSVRKWGHLRETNVDGTQPTLPGSYNQTDITTILPFTQYMSFCIPDPTQRHLSTYALGDTLRSVNLPRTPRTPNFPNLADDYPERPSSSLSIRSTRSEKARFCPSFRYLFFCVHRATTVLSIVATIRSLEHRLPPRVATTLVKTWFVMDMPTNILRRSIFNNEQYWTDLDIRLLCLFCIKLDMAFTDPIDGAGETQLRQMMMAQRSLTVLDQVLRRKQCRDLLEMMRMYVKWKHKPSDENKAYSIFGIPPEQVGSLEKQHWGMQVRGKERQSPDATTPSDDRLLRPDELVLVEGHRRDLNLSKNFMYWLVWGYINPRTMENYPKDPKSMYGKRHQAEDDGDAHVHQNLDPMLLDP